MQSERSAENKKGIEKRDEEDATLVRRCMAARGSPAAPAPAPAPQA